MSDTPPGTAGPLDGLIGHAAEGSAAVQGVARDAAAAAASIDQAFERAGSSLAKSLSKAASDGKLSLGELAAAAIQAIDVFARSSGGSAAGGSLVAALGDVLTSAFAGARADGGAVAGGGAYLVGERGPEVFRPSTAGEVSPVGAGGTTVNVVVQGQGAPAILRSEAQIAAALARAVSMGGAR